MRPDFKKQSKKLNYFYYVNANMEATAKLKLAAFNTLKIFAMK
jgi:hypothetical protein